MKMFKSLMLLSIVLPLVFTSCKKDIIDCHHCFVTHTEDDLLGYSVDIFYNRKGDPDSLSFAGFPVTIEYDHRGRLLKQNFGTTGAHFDFFYKENAPLPFALHYIVPDLGGLIAIDTFEYNFRGEIIGRISQNLLLPAYNLAEKYMYDNRGNITTVSIEAHNGGTVYDCGFTEYIVSKNDNKPIFLGGNIWMKYILLDTGLEPYYFMLYSRNNAADWKYIYDAAGDSYDFTSSFTYDDFGFANSISLDVFDNVAGSELGIFKRNSSSTCDNDNSGNTLTKIPLRISSSLGKKSINADGTPMVAQKH